MSINTEIKFENGSGNVFADLGLEDADDLFERAQIGFHILNLIDRLAMMPHILSELLNITPSDVEELLDGHSSQFSIEQLLDFYQRLEDAQTQADSEHKEKTQYDMNLGRIQNPLPKTAISQ